MCVRARVSIYTCTDAYPHTQISKEIRNNDRSIIDDPEVAEWMWQRVLAVLAHHEQPLRKPETTNNSTSPDFASAHAGLGSIKDQLATWRKMSAVGLNERLRFLRYDPGTYFASHYDDSYHREGGPKQGERSYVTFQLYSNEEFEGGCTRFVHHTHTCTQHNTI